MGNISTKIIAQLSGRNLFGFLKKPIDLPQQIKPDKPPKHNVREEAVLFLFWGGFPPNNEKPNYLFIIRECQK